MDLRFKRSYILWQTFVLTFIMVSANGKSVTTEVYPIVTPSEVSQRTEYPLSRYERGLEDYDEEQERLNQEQGRGMMYDDHEHEPMTKETEKAIKNDPWQGYYDFLINEGSFKFWAVFQVVTAAILIYSALAAVYYAKYNFIQADYDYADYHIFRRSASSGRSTESLWSGVSMETFQRILDAISSKKYS